MNAPDDGMTCCKGGKAGEADASRQALERFSLRDRRDFHRFAVFGHGATGDDDALLAEDFGDSAVG
jgi:hypothetical protein